MRNLVVLGVLGSLPPCAFGQLPDLQPGRNFPTAAAAFGLDRSENIDPGDVDNDGDYDVLVANGGDGPPQQNRLFINNGGLQGGTQGTFGDETATRLLGVTLDTSRDGEFADVDADGDLDVYIANRGGSLVGEVSRAYTNQGGLQFGTIGFFQETTDGYWGTLVSVPLVDEVGLQDGMGPWGDWACDCDFGDLDDDGDLDLFHSSYGPNINGTRESRIFLNDGNGRFDELWPWANPGADIKTHTLDMDLADFDDDRDLDVFMSSRNSQARVYRNNLAEQGGAWTGDPFTDITQTALIDTGAIQVGASNYEAEFADMDGDGDFDIWNKDYNSFRDRLLRNNGDFTFTLFSSWHTGDPNVDDSEVDFLDYDSDGDLDTFLATFSGTNSIYQSALEQGWPGTLSSLYYHCGDTLAAAEAPASGNGGTSLDGECADMDGDGDPDILIANDANQQNRYWVNVLGVPDTHAPTFHFRTVQGDKFGTSPTVLHIQVRDNAAPEYPAMYDARIIYTKDGGPETCVHMFSQGGQQFRGSIPAVNGTITYRFEVSDDAGNTGVSPTESYIHSGVTIDPLWQNVDCGTEGERGAPYLQLFGSQVDGTLVTLRLEDAGPNRLFLLWIATPSSSPFQALGGTVYALPIGAELLLATDSGGMFTGQAVWDADLPNGTQHWWQCIVQDFVNPFGLVLSNAVQGTAP